MIDHVAAVVVGAVVLLTVFALGSRTNDSAVEATQADIAKTDLRALVDAIEQDVTNMGSGLGQPNGSPADRVVTARTSSGGAEAVTFLALPRPGAPTAQAVSYRWRQTGTADGTPLYTVTRETGAGAALESASFADVTTFDMRLRYGDLRPLTPAAFGRPDSLARVRTVDVELAMRSPAGPDGEVLETRWAKRFRPLNLDPAGRLVVASSP